MKIHCSVLAEDAIKAAITDYKKKQETRTARQPQTRRRNGIHRATMINVTPKAVQKIREPSRSRA